MSSELSESEKQVLAEEGVHLPHRGKKRSREKPPMTSEGKGSSSTKLESKWQEVKKYLDPNPHLKSYDEGMSAQKV